VSTFVVKQGQRYVAFPATHTYLSVDEWTFEQMYAWRWCGLESGNGARLTARRIGNGARVIKLVPAQVQSDPTEKT